MMKKTLLSVFALALLATAGFGVNKSMNSDADLSGLALSNVEALAGGEAGGGSSVCCPIWTIAVDFSGSMPMPICVIGGSFRCWDCPCHDY